MQRQYYKLIHTAHVQGKLALASYIIHLAMLKRLRFSLPWVLCFYERLNANKCYSRITVSSGRLKEGSPINILIVNYFKYLEYSGRYDCTQIFTMLRSVNYLILFYINRNARPCSYTLCKRCEIEYNFFITNLFVLRCLRL